MTDKKVTLNDIKGVTWKDYGEAFNKLYLKLHEYSKQNNLKFDIVSPILRSGGVTGSAIAIKFGITAMFPIQLKHQPKSDKPLQILSTPEILIDFKPNNILVCETNTDRGNMAKSAISLIKEKLPKATIYYATLTKVFGGPDTFEGVEEYFYGQETNERLIASPEQCRSLGLWEGIPIFPWENPEEELKQINNEL